MMRNVARSVLLSVLTLALAAIGLATQVGVAFAAPTTCGGVVFHDFDHDGERTEDYSHVSADYAAYQDEGVSGITVLITTVSGATLNATTDAAGAWSANLDTDDFPIRVDFTGLPSGWTSTPKGANSDGLTQHIASDADCGTDGAASAGISAPGSFCDTRPELATTCFLFGNVADHDSQAAVVTLIDGAIDNGGTGGAGWQTDPYTTIATLGQVGAVYGIESNPNDGSVYAASFVKRHTQLGSTDNPTTIYRIDAAGAVAPWFTTDPGATDPHSGATDGWLADHAAFDDVGRSGLGDIEITADGKTLYVVDIGQKELVTIPINSDGTASTGGVTRTAITSSALGAPCVDQDLRPFGLGILDDGSVLISATCTAESTAAGQGPTDPVAGPVLGDPTQLSAAVYEFSGGSFSKVVDVPIPTASRGTQNGGSNFQGVAQWRPWITEPPYATNFVGWPLAGVTYAQPLVSDITQDGDDLIIGIMDIWGHQMGSNAFYLRDGSNTEPTSP